MLAKKKGGFTLIELLVVIAIIAILAAILFPVFARAREAARKSTCQSNMKECAIALQTYWNDYDATLPSSSNGVATTWDATRFVSFSATLGQLQPLPATGAVSWCQKLYNSMKSRDIMFCPSDSVDRHNAGSSPSYWWKLAIDMAWYGVTAQPPGTGTVICKKEGDFGYNADQIVFYEHAGFHSSAQQGLRNDVMINVAFLDTHVKSVSVANSTAVAGAAYVTDSAAGGEPNYFNFDNGKLKDTVLTATSNPAKADTKATFVDPTTCSDMLP